MNRKTDLYLFNNNNNSPYAKKKYEKINIVSKNIARPIKNISDSEGLDIAYRQGNGLYNYGNTLYIAGTKSLGDAYDDLKIPFHATKYSQRYKDAEKQIANPTSGITHVIGHSLGSAVALELQKNYPNLKSTTYAVPTISMSGESQNTRYRNPTDVISILDRGASNVSNKVSLDPFESHSYHNFDNVSGSSTGWVMSKGKNTPYDPQNSVFTTKPIEVEDLK